MSGYKRLSEMLLEWATGEENLRVEKLVFHRDKTKLRLEDYQKGLLELGEKHRDALERKSRADGRKRERHEAAAYRHEKEYDQVAATYREVRESFVVVTAVCLLCDWLDVDDTAALESALETRSMDARGMLLNDLVGATIDEIVESDVWTEENDPERLSPSEIGDLVHEFLDDLTELPEPYEDSSSGDVNPIPPESEPRGGPLSRGMEWEGDFDELLDVDGLGNLDG